jgi:hypothetical protein
MLAGGVLSGCKTTETSSKSSEWVTVSSADFPIAFDVSKLSGDLHATFDKQPIIYMRK